MLSNMMPFLGVYENADGQLVDLASNTIIKRNQIKPKMSPFNGSFLDKDGNLHNISELGGDGSGSQGTVGTNPNILHNWDFRNPVNQRGQTTYNTSLYTIDRWVTSNLVTNVDLTSDGLSINCTGSYGGIRQIIENGYLLAGKQITLSANGKNTSVSGYMTCQLRIYRDGSTFWNSDPVNITTTDFVIISATSVVPDLIPTDQVVVIIVGPNNPVSAVVQSVKLEVGSASTLANDPPMDFGKELSVCQRYQLSTKMQGGANFWRNCGFNISRLILSLLTFRRQLL